MTKKKNAKVTRSDDWANLMTALGRKGIDKRTGAVPFYQPLGEGMCDELYAGDDVARRVVDIIPNEGTREWIEFHVDEVEEKKLTNVLTKLDVRKRINQAWRWARLYGGSGIYLSINDGGKPHEPVKLNNIKSVDSLAVFHRYELYPATINDLDTNIGSPNFGLPETYSLFPRIGVTNPVQSVHHTSRILLSSWPSGCNIQTTVSNQPVSFPEF